MRCHIKCYTQLVIFKITFGQRSYLWPKAFGLFKNYIKCHSYTYEKKSTHTGTKNLKVGWINLANDQSWSTVTRKYQFRTLLWCSEKLFFWAQELWYFFTAIIAQYLQRHNKILLGVIEIIPIFMLEWPKM